MMTGVVRSGPNHYLLSRETYQELKDEVKKRRQFLLCALDSSKTEQLQQTAERQSVALGGVVTSDGE